MAEIKGKECWAMDEFKDTDFGDKRLNARLVKITDAFSQAPQSPINQACNDWAETKAAYRFFQNDKVSAEQIMSSHHKNTACRASSHRIILAVQDTSYLTYTSHKKTTGLGVISRKKGINVESITSNGLIMHTSLALTTDGVPLGFLDQKIYARKVESPELKALKMRTHGNGVPIEDKESFKWLESLKHSKSHVQAKDIQMVTICDREADIYEFFELAQKIDAPVLVRASHNRDINKKSRYQECGTEKLWTFILGLPSQGNLSVKVPKKDKTSERTATLELRFGSFNLNPNRNHIRHKTEKMPDIKLHAVHVIERHPPHGVEALEWLLLTSLPIDSFESAIGKVRWYCLRWRIEVFHKILKSGMRIEECRLATASRLICYLSIMSIIAWRIFWITLFSRENPESPCTIILADAEWKVLYSKFYKHQSLPSKIPSLKEASVWIARLGGFLARKGDGSPGPSYIWRGWKRLCDLSEGAILAQQIGLVGNS